MLPIVIIRGNKMKINTPCEYCIHKEICKLDKKDCLKDDFNDLFEDDNIE